MLVRGRRCVLDYDALSGQLIRAIRGHRSQVAFSRRLGYRANVAYTWESGRRWPSASTFLYAAQRTGLDLHGAFRRFYRIEPEWLAARSDLATPEAVAALLDDLRGTTGVGELATRIGTSRHAVSRWLRGRSEPRLPDFLRAVEAASQRVLDLVAVFADPSELPAARQAWRRLEAARRLFLDQPWAQAVLLALELADYRALPHHDDGWVAARLGLDVDTVARCVAALADSGQIRRAGDHWRVGQVRAVDTRRHPDAGRILKAWWARRGLEHLEADAEGLYSFNVFTVSEADYARLRELHLAHYQAVRTLVARSEPGERVVLTNLQLLPIDEG